MMRRTVAIATLLALLIISSWPAVHSAAQEQRTSVSVVARSYEILDIVWVSTDGSVQWNRWQEGLDEGNGWGSQATGTAKTLLPVSANPTKSGFAMISRRADMLDVYFINSSGSVRNAWWDRAHDGNGLNDAGLGKLSDRWRLATTDLTTDLTSGTQAFPASLESGITVVARDAGHADIFWITSEGEVVRSWWTAVERWHSAERITDPDAADPNSRLAAVSPLGYPDRMAIFWVDQQGRLTSSQNRGEESWVLSSLTQAEAVAPRSGLAALSRATDHLDVFWITPKGAVQTLAWSDEGWQPNPTLIAPEGSAGPESGLAAIAPDPHHLEVYWVSEDGEVFTAAADDDEPGWMLAHTPLAPAGSAAPRGMVAALARTPADRDVFWVTEEGQLGSIKWDPEAERWQNVVTIDPAP